MDSSSFSNFNSIHRNNTTKDDTPTKKPLKPKSFIFNKSKSLKFPNQRHKHFSEVFHSPQKKEQIINQQIFIPKLKNKQLLSEPKFFFSIQRRKSKIQNNRPTFQDIQIKNPEMRGSKIKNDFIKMFFAKRSISFCQKEKQSTQIERNSSFSRKLTSHTSQNLSQNEQKQINRNQYTSQYNYHNQLIDKQKSKKKLKRPNLNENLSFLIRRKKQIKNKISLSRINQSKNYMTQLVRKNPEEQPIQVELPQNSYQF